MRTRKKTRAHVRRSAHRAPHASHATGSVTFALLMRHPPRACRECSIGIGQYGGHGALCGARTPSPPRVRATLQSHALRTAVRDATLSPGSVASAARPTTSCSSPEVDGSGETGPGCVQSQTTGISSHQRRRQRWHGPRAAHQGSMQLCPRPHASQSNKPAHASSEPCILYVVNIVNHATSPYFAGTLGAHLKRSVGKTNKKEGRD